MTDHLKALPDSWPCRCLDHRFVGVEHMIPCCDQPHITAEEFHKKMLDQWGRSELDD